MGPRADTARSAPSMALDSEAMPSATRLAKPEVA
jgi:hypothetical protein